MRVLAVFAHLRGGNNAVPKYRKKRSGANRVVPAKRCAVYSPMPYFTHLPRHFRHTNRTAAGVLYVRARVASHDPIVFAPPAQGRVK